MEYWRTIKNFEDYQISNLGRIKSLKFENENILNPNKNSKGYLQIRLFGFDVKTKKIHVLVYETFNNYKLKDNECVHHKDENKENNNINNLKLMNKSNHMSLHKRGNKNHNFGKYPSLDIREKQSKTMKEKFKDGTLNYKGENCSRSILKENDVIEIIRYLNDNKLSQKEIAEIFDISSQTISSIKNKRIWKHINRDRL